jgi:ubiquinone/menaquinone biosynthesis C-methylase UbiE
MRFDYDQGDIHRTYAAGRVLNPAQRAVWSAVIREEAGARSVRCALDLGCGVGRMTPIVREALGAPVIGIDLSARMLAAAVADPATRGTRWIRASASAIPLRGESVDLIWMFLVFHHLADRLAVLRECARVLAEEASLIIVNSTLETLDGQTWLPFFPSARAIDLARIPSRADVARDAREAGLALRHRVVMNPVSSGLRAYAERVASRTISTLQLVSDEEFARGIEEFRRFAAREDRGQPIVDEIDVFTLRRE